MLDWQREYLLGGQWPTATDPEAYHAAIGWKFFSHGAIARAWAEHRDELLPGYVAAHPGTRPFAWWAFESPELRRMLSGTGEPQWPPRPAERFHPGLLRYAFGVPVASNLTDVDPANPPCFEAQAAFLQRLNLLLPRERVRLGTEAFEPELVLPT